MTELHAGATRGTINPPLGIKRAGPRIFADPIQTVESDLTTTALVLSDPTTRLVIVALDLGLMSLPVITDLRGRITRAVGTPASHVVVNLSHTHSSAGAAGFHTGHGGADGIAATVPGSSAAVRDERGCRSG